MTLVSTEHSPIDSGRRAEYTRAAVDLLDEVGPATQSLGITVAQLSRVTGVHRSVVYRHWETIEELNQELTVLLATGETSWPCRLMAHHPSRPLEAALAASLVDPLLELGISTRLIPAGWSDDHPVRAALAKTDRVRLEELTSWLETHLARRGRHVVPGLTAKHLAMTVTAMVDGHLMMMAAATGANVVAWTAGQRDRLARRVARVIDHATVPARRVAGTGDWSRSPTHTKRVQILADLVTQPSIQPAALEWRPNPTRVVNPGRLARKLGVHERRLYAMWPTASAMNADVASVVLQRDFSRMYEPIAELIDVGAADNAADHERLMIEAAAGVVRAPFAAEGATYLSLVTAMLDPKVRGATVEQYLGFVDLLRTAFLACQAMLGRHRHADFSSNEFAAAEREVVAGLQRQIALCPELADEGVGLAATRVPVLGAIPYLVMLSTTSTQRPRDEAGSIQQHLTGVD